MSHTDSFCHKFSERGPIGKRTVPRALSDVETLDNLSPASIRALDNFLERIQSDDVMERLIVGSAACRVALNEQQGGSSGKWMRASTMRLWELSLLFNSICYRAIFIW